MAAMGSSLLAQDIETGGLRYNINPDSTSLTVIGISSFQTNPNYNGIVDIPSTVLYDSKQYAVTKIGNSAFQYTWVDSLYIPNSVIEIGTSVFNNCHLSRVVVADDNPVFDSRDNCNGIIETATNKLVYGFSTTTIPSTVTEIGNHAYQYSNIVNIIIPNSVTKIDDWAFYECRNLVSVQLSNSITTISEGVFADCTALNGINIPRSVTTISDYAFALCLSLSYLTVEDGNPVYDSRDNCNAIIKTENNRLVVGCSSTIIPNTVTSIGNEAFDGRDGLINITIPNSVTSIGHGAFCGCYNLERMDIPNSVTTIHDYAFSSCSNMTELNIGSGLQQFSTNSFLTCNKLTSITVSEDNPKYDSRDGCNAIIATASNTLVYGCTNTVIPNSVTTIGTRSFYQNYKLRHIDIPASVTQINTYAFHTCSNLESITCRATTPPTIVSNTFSKYNNVILYVPEEAIEAYRSHSLWGKFTDIRPIGSNKTGTPHVGEEGQFTLCLENNESDPDAKIYYAYNYSDYWQEYTGPIEFRDFGYCYFENISFYAVADGKLPSDTVDFEFYVHRYCYDFIDNDIYYLRDNASEAKVSTEYDLQYSLYYGTSSAYSGDVVIPESATDGVRTYAVTSIIPYAFYRCPFVTSVVIPNTVRTIGNSAFEAEVVSRLASVDIGNSVESIGANAFYKCRNITQVICRALTPPAMLLHEYENNDYFSCYGTATLYVPASAAADYRAHEVWGRFTNIVALGDANGDGNITISDVTRLIDIVLKGEEAPAWADINGDGRINISDVTALIRQILSE